MAETLAPEATRTDIVRVLLVEDSVDQQMLARRALEQAGYEVEVAGTGEAAIARLADEGRPEVHLVLLDQGLPMMSGMQALEQIVLMDPAPGAIMVTASAVSDLVVQAMRLGAIDFVGKEPGYHRLLPAVVQRAHRQWDLANRTRELQRLALLVHRSTDLDRTVAEVVTGVGRLCRAPQAVLLLQEDDGSGWRPVAHHGPTDARAISLGQQLLASPEESLDEGGRLAVRLPVEIDEQSGALVVSRSSDRPFAAEERQLVATFAAYASSALRQVRRAELEGGLIAELQQTIRARRDFVASVSHELRTPLTSIGGYAETLLVHRGRLDEDTHFDLLQRIHGHADDLQRLIDQLIDVAKVERGARFVPRPAEVHIPAVVDEVVLQLENVLDGRDVVVDSPTTLAWADADFVGRVLANLLTNAVKYSAPGTPIEVRGRVEETYVELLVRDHGIGIDPGETVLAFQPFWRAGYAVNQAVRGTGIGLSLVQEYVTAMHGQVGCRPSPDGDGSEFWFTLPLAPSVVGA